MKQQETLLTHNPFHGHRLFLNGWTAEAMRRNTRNKKWDYNPWTGQARDIRDVESDATGLLIIPPNESVKAG